MVAQFTSVNWWISVVIVGIIINLISVALLRWLVNQGGKTSSWWRNISEKRQRAWEQDRERVGGSPHEQIICGLLEMRYRLRMLMYMIGGVISWLLGLLITESMTTQYHILLWAKIIFFLMGSVGILGSFGQYQGARYCRQLLYEAIKPNAGKIMPDKEKQALILRLQKWMGLWD